MTEDPGKCPHKPATIREKKFVVCPECQGHDFCVQHLLDEGRTGHFGPWYCDRCGFGVSFELRADGQITLGDTKPAQERRIYRQYVLVEIPPRDKPLRLLCRHLRFSPQMTEESCSNTRFRFEENTSPINILVETIDVTDEVDIKLLDIFDDEQRGRDALFELEYPEETKA